MHLNANVGNKCGRVKEKAVWQRLFVLVKKRKITFSQAIEKCCIKYSHITFFFLFNLVVLLHWYSTILQRNAYFFP